MWEKIKRVFASLGRSGAKNGASGSAYGHDSASGHDRASGHEPAPGGEGEVEMLTCPEVLERLFEYLDEELDPAAQRQVEVHMEICKRCYPRLEFERAFMETLRRTRAGEETPDHLRRRVMDLLAREGLEIA